MAVTRITFVTKPEQLPRLTSSPIHIVLRPNLITNIKKKGNECRRLWDKIEHYWCC